LNPPERAAVLLPQETIRSKREGAALSRAQIEDFVAGLVDARWSDSQAAALAMAIVLRGMDRTETVALTEAMTHSGQVIDWRDAAWGGFGGPVLDKHSTGGVGDKVSLILAPLVAACAADVGGIVPMISGRGLGHTGGTLDKLEALPGYAVAPPRERLVSTLRTAGCAIVGASNTLAPADRRLYAIRDLTATVESVALITASILSKKRAAGLTALVLDVKCGRGAFAADASAAEALARSLVETARGAGLPASAVLSDMDAVLGRSAGNALEVAEALAVLTGAEAVARDRALQRLRRLCLALTTELLVLGGVVADVAAAEARAEHALASGAAAERFARMVAGLGGPADVLADASLPKAPLQRPVPAPRAGCVGAIDVRALGLVVVGLGGGRVRPGDRVDPRVGLAAVRLPGEPVETGQPLAWVHAADTRAAEAACAALAAAMPVVDGPAPDAASGPPLIRGVLR
jgi:thymidine phosphorylase